MWEKNTDWLLPMRASTGDQTCDLSMCPDQELYPQPFGIWNNAPTNWATLTRGLLFFFKTVLLRLEIKPRIQHDH